MEELKKRSIVEYLRGRYRRAKKRQKGDILDELCKELLVSRKHGMRLLRSNPEGRSKKAGQRGRRSKYRTPEVVDGLRLMWRQTRHMCSRHLKAAMPHWIRFVAEEVEGFEDGVRELLLQMSAATIDRILHPYKAEKGVSFTRPGGFRDEIPIQENLWNITVPGYVETDTVAHCGGSLLGEFIYSITVTDICTTWTEVRGTFGKSSGGVISALLDIELSLPFELLGYDADNGTEVLNKHILAYFVGERLLKGLPPVTVTRAREYRKNDNAHVEQRNDSFARRYLGYERLEFVELAVLINHYYANVVCPLQNHFFPSFKLQDKIRIKSRTRRIYRDPVTPYDRVMNCTQVSGERKALLQQIHEKLNPVHLVTEERRLRKLIDQAVRKLRRGESIKHLEQVFVAPQICNIRSAMEPVAPLILTTLSVTPSQYRNFYRESRTRG